MNDRSIQQRQLGLFGEPRPSRAETIQRAEPSRAVRALARCVPSGLHLGTSSWSFPGWSGLVFDRSATRTLLARDGLSAYAQHPLFNTVGLDRTWYAPISAGAFAQYAAAVPERFRFVVKAHADLTSPQVRDYPTRANPRFLDPTYAVDRIIGPWHEGLGAKAGILLFQFSPLPPFWTWQPERFAEVLYRFLVALPRGPRYAVEIRNRELLSSDYFQALAEARVEHCFNVHPRMPPIDDQMLQQDDSGGLLLIRWMLHAGFGYEQAKARYAPFDRLVDEDPVTRQAIAIRCQSVLRDGKEVFVIANNKAEGSAPLSLVKLAENITD